MMKTIDDNDNIDDDDGENDEEELNRIDWIQNMQWWLEMFSQCLCSWMLIEVANPSIDTCWLFRNHPNYSLHKKRVVPFGT